MDYGLKHNRNRTIYANEKKIADAKAKEMLAAYLPTIGINSSLDNNLKVQQTVIPGGIFGPNDIRVAFTKKINTNHVARIDQTIYDQSLLIGLKANSYNAQQATLNERQSEETIIYNVGNAYTQVFVYREQLHLLGENLRTYQQQQEINALKVKKGVLLQKDLDRISVDYNNTFAQIKVAESNLTLCENQLKFEMGYPLDQPLALDSISAEKLFVQVSQHTVDSGHLNLDNRIDFQLSKINAKLLEIDQKRIKATAMPKLTAYAQYGAIGFGDYPASAFSTLTPYSAVGLKLSIPFFDFLKRNAQYNQAKYKSLNAQEEIKMNEDKFNIEYLNAQTKVIKEQGNLENNRRNIALAQAVLNITDLQLRKGTTNITEWLNAQNALKESQNNYLNSLYAYFQARMEIEKAGGSLKTFYNDL
ncbi:outer membrane protein TolC [Pedobacter sp. AK013]|uniref:TolC family protein n=1 Tax=Pedobacter sp. AK013 TaxID=2723071 RepID=UPI00179D4B07|nr:TolC family protein [Pedobacter sp. AK013]MBB6239932.1 outer membrane protein TolC [Pedobacter sp. AK013]